MTEITPFSPIVGYTYHAAKGNYTDRSFPHLIHTLHDVECPPGPGWVQALLGANYFGKAGTGVSIQGMIDAAVIGQGAPLGLQCWHVGGPGNQLAAGWEQAGYASFTTNMWTGTERVGATYRRPNGQVVAWTAADNKHMAAQFELVAKVFAEVHRVCGIPLVWLTLADLRQAKADYLAGRRAVVTGFCRHQDWTASGASSTSHHDPGDNYPTGALMDRARQLAGQTPVKPTPTPSGNYRVKAGDTLSGIAARLLGDAGRYMDIARLNNLADPNRINVGQVLAIPGGVTATPATPAPPYTKPPGAFRLPAGHFYGLITGPATSHGGYYAAERPYVRWIQVRMQELGFAPKAPGWADGKFEQPTKDAVAAWQRARHARTTSRYGEVWADDWRNLTVDR